MLSDVRRIKVLRFLLSMVRSSRIVFIAVLGLCLIVIISLLLGIDRNRIGSILLISGVASILIFAVWYISDLVINKTSSVIAEITLLHNEAEIQESFAEQSKERDESRQRDELFWKKATVGEVLKSLILQEYYWNQEIVETLPPDADKTFNNFILLWLLKCAVEFYEIKGMDISDVLLVEFERRLYLDGFTNEFYNSFWTNSFFTEYSKYYAKATLQIIYRSSGLMPFISSMPAQFDESILSDEAMGNDGEEWADVIV